MANPDPNLNNPENRALVKTGDLLRETPAPMILQLGGAQEDAAGAFSFSILWQALMQRVRVAAPLGVLLAAAACAILCYVTEPKYKSLATMRIVDKQPALVFHTTENSQAFAQTQIELLRGPFIISRAIESEELGQLPELVEIANKEDPVNWISQRLKAGRIGQSEMYEVSFTTRHAESARRIVTAVVDTYMRFQTGETDTQRQKMLEILKDEANRIEGDIANKRKNLRDIAQSAADGDGVVIGQTADGTTAPSAVGRFALLTSLEQKLVTAKVDIEVAKARVKALSPHQGPGGGTDGPEADGNDVEIPEEYIETELAKDAGIARLNKSLEDNQRNLGVLSEKSPKYARVQQDIKKAEDDLAARKVEMRSKVIAQAQELFAAHRRDELNQAVADLKARQQAALVLEEGIREEREKQGAHSDKSLELKFAHDELRNVQDVHKQISDRIVHLQTEGRAPAQVLNYQKPKTPDFTEGPTLAKKLVMIGGAAFFAPFMLLIGWDLMHRRVFERQQLEREFNLKLVSEVAALPVRPLLPRPGAHRAYQLQSHLFEESVNALRTSLAVDEKLRNCRVFVVASAVSGEGKTNLAAQLAMSWSHAIAGKVLVIDADLRAPNLHDLFEMKQGPGMAEVLRGECPVENAITMDWGDRLFVLPAGDAGTSSPSHLFAGSRFRSLLAQLSAQFDKVIIDVPPVLCASETLLIAKEADAALLCARHDFSRAGQLKQAYERLAAGGVNVAGAVLNGAPVRKYTYSYRGYAPI
jgi:capsular exopolysaccharide synthesis family protein